MYSIDYRFVWPEYDLIRQKPPFRLGGRFQKILVLLKKLYCGDFTKSPGYGPVSKNSVSGVLSLRVGRKINTCRTRLRDSSLATVSNL